MRDITHCTFCKNIDLSKGYYASVTKEPTSISQKIRRARLEKGLTQGELAGDEITRNMMCRIETGTATPSRATLAYLAERLDLPLLYLLDDTLTLDECAKHLYMSDVRREFKEGHYAEALRLIRKHFKDYDDETALIAAHCLLSEAEKKLHNGNLESADKTIKEALSLTEKTVYPTSDIRASLSLLSALASNVQSPRYEIDEESYLHLRNDSVMQDLYAYLTDDASSCREPLYLAHIKAREYLRARDYRSALARLQALEERRLADNMSAILIFRIYTDLETCYRELGDFQNAYRYAGKRISMLAAFKS